MGFRDVFGFIASSGGALVWTHLVHSLARRGVIRQELSRKVVHIGTGCLFMLTWPLYSSSRAARWLAASVPLAFSVRLGLVGVGVLSDPGAVAGMTRNGDKRELLSGPMMYGLVHAVATVCFWRDTPHGILALVCLCVGDGFADIIGRRFGGSGRWPHSKQKSFAGSAAFVVASTLVGTVYLHVFGSLSGRQFYGKLAASASDAGGAMAPPPSVLHGSILVHSLIVAFAAAAVESLPFREIDNVTLTLAAALTSLWRYS